MQAQTYRNASRPLLAQAMEEWDQGDARQASEKGWGAAAQMVKAIAEQRGWQHNNHPSLFITVNRLARETGDHEISTLFHTAGALHTNFYENWFNSEIVEDGLRDVGRFLDKLEPLLR